MYTGVEFYSIDYLRLAKVFLTFIPIFITLTQQKPHLPQHTSVCLQFQKANHFHLRKYICFCLLKIYCSKALIQHIDQNFLENSSLSVKAPEASSLPLRYRKFTLVLIAK